MSLYKAVKETLLPRKRRAREEQEKIENQSEMGQADNYLYYIAAQNYCTITPVAFLRGVLEEGAYGDGPNSFTIHHFTTLAIRPSGIQG